MKSLGGRGQLVSDLGLTAQECRRYSLSLSISTLICGIQSQENLRAEPNNCAELQPDLRSGMGSTFSLAPDYLNPLIWAGATRLLEEYQSVRHFFAGYFYPLTSYSVDDAA